MPVRISVEALSTQTTLSFKPTDWAVLWKVSNEAVKPFWAMSLPFEAILFPFCAMSANFPNIFEKVPGVAGSAGNKFDEED